MLGTPACEAWLETWPEIWHEIGPLVDRVMRKGEAIRREDFRAIIDRNGFPEEVFGVITLSPIFNARGIIVGVQKTLWETTGHIVVERRMRVLRAFTASLAGAATPREACERAAEALVTELAEVPFALLYLLDQHGQ